jgi:hypothetical protein
MHLWTPPLFTEANYLPAASRFRQKSWVAAGSGDDGTARILAVPPLFFAVLWKSGQRKMVLAPRSSRVPMATMYHSMRPTPVSWRRFIEETMFSLILTPIRLEPLALHRADFICP